MLKEVNTTKVYIINYYASYLVLNRMQHLFSKKKKKIKNKKLIIMGLNIRKQR
jgi:hypothetical protein